jgi:hypothetical protein
MYAQGCQWSCGLFRRFFAFQDQVRRFRARGPFGRRATWKALIAIIFALGLSACGPSLSGLYKLSQIDFKTTDVAQLRFAVQLPKHVLARLQHVELEMRLSATDTQLETGELFFLKPVQSALEQTALQQYQRPDAAIRIYRIGEEDIARFNLVRSARDNDGASRNGSMTLRTQLCRDAEAPAETVLVSSFLMAAETGEFVPLMLNFDAGKAMETAGRQMPLC